MFLLKFPVTCQYDNFKISNATAIHEQTQAFETIASLLMTANFTSCMKEPAGTGGMLNSACHLLLLVFCSGLHFEPKD
jgi:hypothetical protein